MLPAVGNCARVTAPALPRALPRTKPVLMFHYTKKANNKKGSLQRQAENQKRRRIRLEEAHFHCVRLIQLQISHSLPVHVLYFSAFFNLRGWKGTAYPRKLMRKKARDE